LGSVVSENSSSFQPTPRSEKFEFIFAATATRMSDGASVSCFDVVSKQPRLSMTGSTKGATMHE